jgi:N-acetylglucosaminyldiphosphoundecaprenol N-acetyl-beta-D-mannosaminyltransferase
MIDHGRRNVAGILVNALDYEAAVEAIVRAAKARRAFSVSTAAVHAVMQGVLSPEHKFRLNHLDMITPDGQPVRWALNLLHETELRDRVYGPNLTLKLCARAEADKLGVFFYGNTSEVLAELRQKLEFRFPHLCISGMAPSQFRQVSLKERDHIARQIRGTGASLVFLGLGCPRQDVWAYEYRDVLSIPIVAVGGAFGVIAGKVSQAPEWMQQRGLEWMFRLLSEPRRLWRRYVLLNPAYVFVVLSQALGLARFDTSGRKPATELRYG